MSTKVIIVLALLVLASPLVFAQFGYNCQGGYGYGYNCNNNDDNDDSQKHLSVSLDSSCEANVVTVTGTGGDGVANAHVTVKDVDTLDIIASGDTNGDGEFTFSGCGMHVDVKVTKSGYTPETKSFNLVACTQCTVPECTTDAQCPATEKCSNQECVPVNCGPCQQADNHMCKNLCSATEMCVDNQCKPKEQPECTTDLNCKMNEFCNIPPGQSGGSCKEITGCGTVDNHKLTPYECGDGVSCPQCPAGEQCIDHACKTFSINCPATAIVGDEKQCTAMVDGEPCKECQVEVTDPS